MVQHAHINCSGPCTSPRACSSPSADSTTPAPEYGWFAPVDSARPHDNAHSNHWANGYADSDSKRGDSLPESDPDPDNEGHTNRDPGGDPDSNSWYQYSDSDDSH